MFQKVLMVEIERNVFLLVLSVCSQRIFASS
jgi:hypothetical protein